MKSDLKTELKSRGVGVRLILIGERFFHNFESMEIIGDMYQSTEAFCHYSLNSPEGKKNNLVKFHTFGKKKNRKVWKIEKLREKNVQNLGENPPIKECTLLSYATVVTEPTETKFTGEKTSMRVRLYYCCCKESKKDTMNGGCGRCEASGRVPKAGLVTDWQKLLLALCTSTCVSAVMKIGG